MKKVIVTGSTGQDGSYMIDYLLDNTQDTIIAAMRRTSQPILNNLSKALNNPRVKFVTVDLCDGEAIRKLIKDEKPDYFINFGAQTFVADSWKNPVAHMMTNAISLIYVLEAIREYAPYCRVYSSGSSEQMGDVKYSPQNEDHPMSPRSVYGVSKCTAEHLCKVYRESYGLYVVHGKLFNHESPRRQEYFLTRKVTKYIARNEYRILSNREGAPLQVGNLNAKRDWSHAKDFIQGIWMMLNQDKPKNYVLSSGETHTVREFIEKAFSIVNINGKWVGEGENEKCLFNNNVIVEVNKEFYRPAEVELLLGDSSLIRRELGWVPKYNFEMLVREMVESDRDIYRYEG